MLECLRDHSSFHLIKKPSKIVIYRTGSIVSSLHALLMKRERFYAPVESVVVLAPAKVCRSL